MREKTLQLAGRVGDGSLLTAMSSPEYVRWAVRHIRSGMVESGQMEHRVAVYLNVKVNPDGEYARARVRRLLACQYPWSDVQVNMLGIAGEVEAFIKEYGVEGIEKHLPDAWLDAFAASGTPGQAAVCIRNLFDAGADTVIFQPLDGDPDCLDEYANYLMPLLLVGK